MNTKQEHTLLPCPFCGGKPRISKQMGESLWSHDIVLWTGVQCDECEAQVGPTCEGYEVEAVDIWNSRAVQQSQDKAEPSEWLKQHEALMHRVSKAALVVGYGGTINGTAAEQALENAEKALLDHALALQSQDRGDVATLKAGLEEAAQTMRAVLAQERLKAVAKRCLSRAIVVCDRAIDHARRVNGNQ